MPFDPSAHADTAKGPAAPEPVTGTDVLPRLADAMRSDLDGVTDRATRRILESIDAYVMDGDVPREDLWWSVRRNVEVVINALATQQPPGPEDLALRRELGVRRAEQGLALLDLMRAFRLGYLELWEVLFELARDQGQEAVTALAGDAALVWNTMDQVSSAVEEGYRDQLARTGQDQRHRALALLTALRAGRQPETGALLEALGHDPGGWFEAAAIGRGPNLGAPRGEAIAIEQADHLVLITSWHRKGVRRLVDGHPLLAEAPHVGIGGGPVRRTDLARAIDEAESALSAAAQLGQRCLVHDEQWFDCMVLASRDALPDRVVAAARAIAQDDDLAATLTAVLAHDGNATRAAADVHLHPNGVTYRLRRFAERHGIDARTSAGATDARAAMTVARTMTAQPPRDADVEGSSRAP